MSVTSSTTSLSPSPSTSTSTALSPSNPPDVINPEAGYYPTPSSKYDFVKVKVWLEDHYYVLSRFLISRVLNVTKVNAADSVRITLELKKRLVDDSILDVSQTDMENLLFSIMQTYGYGEKYVYRYRMTTRFHHQRVPLIILLCGTRCIGKSWLSTQLAERLNLSTVLQTTLVHELMYTIMKDLPAGIEPPKTFPPPNDVPLIYRNIDEQQLIEDFKSECLLIRHGIDTDIEKCFEEGKAIIIEGHSLDPSLFIDLIEERGMDIVNPQQNWKFTSTTPRGIQNNTDSNNNNNNNSNNNNNNNNSTSTHNTNPSSTNSSASSSLNSSSDGITNTSTPSLPKKKKKTKGIIIPFILNMSPTDHRFLIENWLSCSPHDQKFLKNLGDNPVDQTNALLHRLQVIQGYVCQKVPPFIKVDVSAQSFLDTLDSLHSIVLDRIQQVYAGPVDGFAE